MQLRSPIRIGVLTMALLAGGSLGASAATDESVATKTAAAAIPFELREGCQIFVIGRGDNGRPLRMMVELGRTRTIVDTRVASQVFGNDQLKSIVAASGMTQTRSGMMNVFEFGPVHLKEIGVLVTDMASFPGAPTDTDVILGLDILTRTNLTID